jgi:hypothetical protein
MLDHSAAGPAEDISFSEALRRLGEREGGRLKVRELVTAFGDRAFGAIMLVVALINVLPLPPGSTTVTGAPLVLMSIQLAMGREQLWLPRKMLELSVPRVGFRKAVSKASRAIKFAERLSAPRLEFLVGQTAQRVIGVVCLLLAVELVLPIPLGNMVPAIAVALLSLGIMQRDGVAVILGGLATGASALLLVLVWKTLSLAVTSLIDGVTGFF